MSEKRKILLLESSPSSAKLLTNLLTERGFDVKSHHSGYGGIQLVYSFIPDLIVMSSDLKVLSGLQTAMFLKNRRSVRNIPIILHTSKNDPNIRFMASLSSVDDIVLKDPDNPEELFEAIEFNRPVEEIQEELIRKEAPGINGETVLSGIARIYEKNLFRQAIRAEMNDMGRSFESMETSINRVLRLLRALVDIHIATIILNYNKTPHVFTFPGEEVYQREAEDFNRISIYDYQQNFPDNLLDEAKYYYFGISDRDNFQKVRIDKKSISSYLTLPIKGANKMIVGSIHLGHFSNNYFSDRLSLLISIFMKEAGVVLHGALNHNIIYERGEKVRRVFARFIPDDIIDTMVEQDDAADMLVGERRNLAVLFSDIRSFTEISENNRADDLVAFLNSYFQIMGEIIKKHGGTIDKFIGDAILAIFGAPRSYPDNARRAVSAAIDMVHALERVPKDRIKLPPGGFNIGIGIHEGDAIVGNIGSRDKVDYTVIGDTVNLSSRLEGLTKHYKKRIVISETIHRKVRDEFLTRELDKVKVKGKEEATSIYSVDMDGSALVIPEVVSDYQKGLQMYKIKNFRMAMDYFQRVKTVIPDDFICQLYIERCSDYLKNPPPDDWTGAVALDFK